MYLLYLDESGSVTDRLQTHFVLAGIAVFERQSFWLSNEMDKIAARFDSQNINSVELHGNPMFGGKKNWRKYPKEMRMNAIKDCLQVLVSSHSSNKIFASVINKNLLNHNDPIEIAFEQISSRIRLLFD